MKHPASREMYAYWTARRGVRRAPNRSEIDPGAIRSLLSDSFMINREPAEETVFRLAGTRVCDMFGRELKGDRFLSLWDARSHADLRMLLDLAVDHAQGFVAGVVADVDDGKPTRLELLLLPLYRIGTAEARSIGTLAAFERGRHLQLHAVSGLYLEGWRYVGADTEASLIPRDLEHTLDRDLERDLERDLATEMTPDVRARGWTILPGGRS